MKIILPYIFITLLGIALLEQSKSEKETKVEACMKLGKIRFAEDQVNLL
jgi:hypothetical protein